MGAMSWGDLLTVILTIVLAVGSGVLFVVRQMERLKDRVYSLDRLVVDGKLAERTAVLESKVSGHSDGFDAISKRFDSLDTKMTNGFENLGHRIDNLAAGNRS